MALLVDTPRNRVGTAGRHHPPVPQQERVIDRRLAGWAAATSLAALVVLIGLPPLGSNTAAAVRATVLTAFWLMAPGAVVLRRVRAVPLTKVALVPVLGLCALIAVGSLGAWTGLWFPRTATAVVAVVTGLAGFLALRSDSPTRSSARRPRPRSDRGAVVVVLALCGSLGAWIIALVRVDDAEPSVLGLLVAGPRTLAVALVLAGVALVLALRLRRSGLVVATVGVLILVFRSTASVVNTVPIAAWSYKHIGVVSALQEYQQVLEGSDIYMNWPGMFAATAYLGEASGVSTIAIARWTTPLVHVLLALSTAALARAFGARTVGCAAAGALVVVFNWVGQDYFSPQAVAIVLSGGLLVALAQARRDRTMSVMALVIYAGVVVTHQLTPVWLLALAIALAVFRRIPWWVPAGMAALVLTYVLSHYAAIAQYGLFSGFDPVGNASINVAPVEALGRDVGGLFSKVSAVLLWSSTFVVLLARARRLGWRRTLRTRTVAVPAIMAFSPFLLLGGQSYGGEAILRVTLYSTLASAAVLGPSLARAVTTRAGGLVGGTLWLAVTVAVTGQSTYGQWWVNLIKPEDVATSRWLAEEQPDSVVIPVNLDWPGRSWVDYARYTGEDEENETSLERILQDELPSDPFLTERPTPVTEDDVAAVAGSRRPDEVYVVFTAAMRAYDAYYRTFADGAYERLLTDMAASSDWRLVRQTGDVWVFQYRAPSGES
ncbi:hypothetical protein [Geodermatophilus sp. SYSU D00766]